jgi:SpoVK/Ycf46/Vps4 family AAA+-type ATPase
MAVLEAALDRDGDQAALRIQVSRLYLEGGEPENALRHAEEVLARQPANLDALPLAASAADAIGQVERAAGFRTLLQALTGSLPPPAAPAKPSAQGEHSAPAEQSASAEQSAPAEMSPAQNPPGAPEDKAPEPIAVGDEISSEDVDAFLRDVLGEDPDLERPQVTLADVGGLVDVKRRLQTSFLGPMRNPELRRMYGKSLRGGLLLYGPPGCGKTFLARAVAGELGAHFFGVGLHDVLDMWLGKSEQNVHKVFETARRYTPCVLFLDEVDALGMKRSNLAHSSGRNVVVQLLTELDGAQNENEGVFMLGATNQPWDIDPALRRPGRFDRMLLVLPPDPPARAAILSYHLKDRPVDPAVNLERVVTGTENYSGADLRLVCESATERALEQSMESGVVRPISQEDFELALRDVKPSTRPWFEMARNYAMFANDGGVYDDLLAFMRQHRLA